MALDSGPLLIVQTLKRHVTDRCEPFLAAKNQLRESIAVVIGFPDAGAIVWGTAGGGAKQVRAG
jgi:hypothetical protein